MSKCKIVIKMKKKLSNVEYKTHLRTLEANISQILKKIQNSKYF